tara:strand:+ start:2424 stop:6407 length:3984 start_codon:yes stop_codon:yes gene_type:complete
MPAIEKFNQNLHVGQRGGDSGGTQFVSIDKDSDTIVTSNDALKAPDWSNFATLVADNFIAYDDNTFIGIFQSFIILYKIETETTGTLKKVVTNVNGLSKITYVAGNIYVVGSSNIIHKMTYTDLESAATDDIVTLESIETNFTEPESPYGDTFSDEDKTFFDTRIDAKILQIKGIEHAEGAKLYIHVNPEGNEPSANNKTTILEGNRELHNLRIAERLFVYDIGTKSLSYFDVEGNKSLSIFPSGGDTEDASTFWRDNAYHHYNNSGIGHSRNFNNSNFQAGQPSNLGGFGGQTSISRTTWTEDMSQGETIDSEFPNTWMGIQVFSDMDSLNLTYQTLPHPFRIGGMTGADSNPYNTHGASIDVHLPHYKIRLSPGVTSQNMHEIDISLGDIKEMLGYSVNVSDAILAPGYQGRHVIYDAGDSINPFEGGTNNTGEIMDGFGVSADGEDYSEDHNNDIVQAAYQYSPDLFHYDTGVNVVIPDDIFVSTNNHPDNANSGTQYFQYVKLKIGFEATGTERNNIYRPLHLSFTMGRLVGEGSLNILDDGSNDSERAIFNLLDNDAIPSIGADAPVGGFAVPDGMYGYAEVDTAYTSLNNHNPYKDGALIPTPSIDFTSYTWKQNANNVVLMVDVENHENTKLLVDSDDTSSLINRLIPNMDSDFYIPILKDGDGTKIIDAVYMQEVISTRSITDYGDYLSRLMQSSLFADHLPQHASNSSQVFLGNWEGITEWAANNDWVINSWDEDIGTTGKIKVEGTSVITTIGSSASFLNKSLSDVSLVMKPSANWLGHTVYVGFGKRADSDELCYVQTVIIRNADTPATLGGQILDFTSATYDVGGDTHFFKATPTIKGTTMVLSQPGADLNQSLAKIESIAKGDGAITNFYFSTGSNNATCLYKLSYLYDGFQESPLSTIVGENDSTSDDLSATITIYIDTDIPAGRITHVNLYRYYVDSASADLGYVFLKSFPVDPSSLILVSGTTFKATFVDKNLPRPTYDSIVGISETMNNTSVNYTLSTQLESYLFVSGGDVGSLKEDVSRYIFRSKPGKFSQFDWSNDYQVMPEELTALKAFNGRIYAFTAHSYYRLNPATLEIEDEFEGIGCIDSNSIIVTDYGMCFADSNNIYLHNGQQAMNISSSIATSSDTQSPGWQGENKTNIHCTFSNQRQSFLIFFTTTIGNKCWAYNVPRKRWDLLNSNGEVTGTVIDKNNNVLYTTAEGNIYKHMSASTNRNWSWYSKKLTMGQDTQAKRLKKLRIQGNANLTTETCRIYTNGNLDTSYSEESVAEGEFYEQVYKPTANKKFKTLEVQLENIDGNIEVDALGVIFKRKSLK